MLEESDRLALHLRRLRLRHFEILLAVARHGSLTAAAQALDCGQPAVSQWLAEIEAAVDVRLFERGRQLKPTPHLAPVLRHARRVVADGQRLQRELDAVSAGAQGVVRIGTMVVASAGLLPRALLALRASGSPMRLEVVEDIAQGLWERFERRELDLIVGRLDERAFAPHIEAQALYQDPHCVVAGRKHPLLRGTPSWDRAARHPVDPAATPDRAAPRDRRDISSGRFATRHALAGERSADRDPAPDAGHRLLGRGVGHRRPLLRGTGRAARRAACTQVRRGADRHGVDSGR